MSRVGAVVKREFGAMAGSRLFLIGTILGPLIVLLPFLLPALFSRLGGERAVPAVEFVAPEPGGRAADIAGALTAPGESAGPAGTGFRVAVVADSTAAESLRPRIARGELDAVVLIPDAGSPDAVRYEGRTDDALALARIRMAVERAVQRARLEAAGIDPDAAFAALEPVAFETRVIESPRAQAERHGAFELAVIVNFAMYFVILIYGISVLRAVQEEKEQRIVEILLSSMRPSELMTGKVLGIGAAGLLQVAVWVAFAAAALAWGGDAMRALGVDPPSLPRPPLSLTFVILGFFLGGFLLYASIYAAFGAVATSSQDVQQLQLPVLVPLIVSFFMTFAIAEDPGGRLAVVGSLVPFSSPLVVPVRAALGAIGPGELALSLALLAVACAGTLWLAGRVFRVTILATGSRPGLGRIWRWLRTG